MIAISSPWIGDLEEKLVLEVLRSGRLAKGEMIQRFEGAIADATGCSSSVAVMNGTSALIAALLAHEIGPGDEVVTSPFTFVATLNAVLHVGATPRFVDVGDDFDLDVELLDAAISPATRAVLPVHLYGCPTDMGAVEEIARHHGLAIVEDAAQALGATCAGRPVGSFGTGAFSFYASKNITTGEGGAVTTNDMRIAERVRVLADQGQRATYDYVEPGFNFRMSELQAALGVAQMVRLGDITDARRRNARLLDDMLDGLDGLVLPTEPPGRRHVYHQYTVRVTADAPIARDELLARLLRRGIQCGVYYPRPVYAYACFRDRFPVESGSLPNVEAVADQVLSLPVHPRLTESDVQRVGHAVREELT